MTNAAESEFPMGYLNENTPPISEQEDLSISIREELSESGEPTGVEADDSDSLIEPFDTDLISIEQRGVPMDTLVRRLKQGSIRLNPNFQRNEVWDNGQRSRLIESIILRIPLPMFYVAADTEGRWDVVDGLQRLSTIRNFILGDGDGNTLRLENLEFLDDRLNGKTYKELEDDPSSQRIMNIIMESEMRFTIINPGTPDDVKRNVFKRLNTGGLPLTRQEIRHALYQGQVTDLLKDLTESQSFKKATGDSINDSRMAAREIILYFLAFAIFPNSSYKGNMDIWLSNAMRVINLMPDLEQSKLIKIFGGSENIPKIEIRSIESLKNHFELAMTRAYNLFGEHSFRKSLPKYSKRRTPINKALFETWGNILALLSQNDFDLLLKEKQSLIIIYHTMLNGNEAIAKDSYKKIERAMVLEIENCDDLDDEEKKELRAIRVLALILLDEDLTKVDEREATDAKFDPFYSMATQMALVSLFAGRLGELFNDAVSRNASEVDSVEKRYKDIGDLIVRLIRYKRGK